MSVCRDCYNSLFMTRCFFANLQNLLLLLLLLFQQLLLFYMNLLLPVFYGNAIPAVMHGKHTVVAIVVVAAKYGACLPANNLAVLAKWSIAVRSLCANTNATPNKHTNTHTYIHTSIYTTHSPSPKMRSDVRARHMCDRSVSDSAAGVHRQANSSQFVCCDRWPAPNMVRFCTLLAGVERTFHVKVK